MSEVSNDRVWLRWGTLAAALLVLDASVTFRNLWPTPAVRWNGELSVELAALVACLVLAFRRNGQPSRSLVRGLAAGWVVLIISRYADVTAPALYGREVNLFWDGRRLSAVAAMLFKVASPWVTLAVLAATILIPLALYAAVRRALGRLAVATSRAGERRALGIFTAAALVLFAAQQLLPGMRRIPAFSHPVVATYARQIQLAAAAMSGARTRNIDAPAELRLDLARVRGADVFLIFIESYGAVSFDRPAFASDLAGSRARLADDIHATGRSVVSAFVESPTFGGNSWLAHVSLLSGVEVRDEDTNIQLMKQKRDTLVTAFGRQGYRTLAIMPGLHESWPEGAFYGFNEIYDENRLNYQGPPFGWWSVPDQFVIAKMDGFVAAGGSRAPSFTFFPTTNTHTPFSPTPPYQPDWARVLTDDPFDMPDLQRAWAQEPEWLELGPGYVRAVAYTYETLGGYLRLRSDRDFVMIVLGDHQPPAVVSGEGASWEVPVHVIASRQDILDSLVHQGFRTGLTPAHPAVSRMNELLALLMKAFSNETPAAASNRLDSNRLDVNGLDSNRLHAGPDR
jgi:hypothetical protein